MARRLNRCTTVQGILTDGPPVTTWDLAHMTGLSPNKVLNDIDQGVLLANRQPYGKRHYVIHRPAARLWLHQLGYLTVLKPIAHNAHSAR